MVMRAAAAAPGFLRRLFSRNYSLLYPWFVPRSEPKPSNRLRVVGLHKRTTSAELFKAFQKFGQVVYARVATEPNSRYNKGYGYVRFAILEDAIKAIKGGDRMFLNNRAMLVDYAKPISPRKSKKALQSGGQNNGNPDGHQ